jgi:polyisoprenoid-binding protein YceI
MKTKAQIVWAALIASLGCAAAANAQPRAIDTAKSVLTIRVSKAGLLSAVGHNHEIAAPISSGTLDVGGRRVELHALAGKLEVRDPGVSGKDRAEIQSTMLGPQVLDAAGHPEIVFRSTSVEAAGAGSWKVTGELTLRGQTHTVVVEVREDGEHYVGTASFKQTEFGIQPVKVAGGTIRVKDEIRIEFNVQLAR